MDSQVKSKSQKRQPIFQRLSECSWISESIQKFRKSCLGCKCLDAGTGDEARRKSCLTARKQDTSHD